MITRVTYRNGHQTQANITDRNVNSVQETERNEDEVLSLAQPLLLERTSPKQHMTSNTPT